MSEEKIIDTGGQELLSQYLYPNEPPAFTAKDLDPFLIFCTRANASDITIQVSEPVICEIQGRMRRVTRRRLNKNEVSTIIVALYGNEGIMAKLNGIEDGDSSYEIKPDRDTRMRFRVNYTAIKSHGHTAFQITLRTIPGMPPHIDTMNVEQEILDNIAPKNGLVLITGATGSGKSTLLASTIRMLMEMPEGHHKIITYEAPIEYVYDDVSRPTTSIAQSAIGENLPSFSAGIRNGLRRKPTIMMVGEMRDRETIAEGLIASMTGHLVYSTLHSNSASSVVSRMVNVFAPEEKYSRAIEIVSNVKLIVSQMLLPSTDGKRVAIREYLVFNDDIVDKLIDGGVDNLSFTARKVLKEYGRSFLEDAEDKFRDGRISDFEFKRIVKMSRGSDGDAMSSIKAKQLSQSLLGVDLSD